LKKFITFIPRQAENALKSHVYQAVDNQRLAYEKPTKFPVVSLLHGFAEKDETVQVITVCEDYDNSRRNLECLKQELEVVSADMATSIQLVVLDVPYDDGIDAQLETFQKLIDVIEDNDLLFACITYGGKPTPVIQTMVLRYAKLARKNTTIRCVVYGQLDHETGIAKIYDVTALMRMDDILRLLASSGAKDIKSSIRKILEL
jgi:hypothetical protein